jgi:hypothetical protein
MASEIALYYPYIHFQDDAWVKEAALYWDRLSRIVPEGYAHKLHDSDVVKALKAEGDVIVDRTPAWETVHAVSEELLAVVNGHGDALKSYLAPQPFLDGDTGSLAYLYHSKMDWELVEVLQQSGLGTFRSLDGDMDEEWLGVHPKIGQAYMTALASSMGRRGALSVVSDNPNFAIAGCGFPVRQLFVNLIDADDARLASAYGERASSMLGIAAIENVLPANIASIPVEKIIEFRNESIEERARYREAVARATGHLTDVSDPEALRDHLEISGPRIRAAVQSLQGRMDSLLGDTVTGVVGVSKDLPGLAGIVVATLGISMTNPFVAGAGIAFNAYRAVRDKRRENDALLEQPYAYLVSMQEQLGMTGFLGRLRSGGRRLLLGE